MKASNIWDGKSTLRSGHICVIRGSNTGMACEAKILYIDKHRCVWRWQSERNTMSVHNVLSDMEITPIDVKALLVKRELEDILAHHGTSQLDDCVDALIKAGYVKGKQK